MKINSMLGAMNFLNIGGKGGVANQDSRAEKDGGNGRDQYSRTRKEDTGSDEDSPSQDDPESHRQKMRDAVDAFVQDPLTQASGLSAEAEGQGPGLRVVVKDSGGGVVRQFTGEEFLKLREAVGQDKRSRGKILDQKL